MHRTAGFLLLLTLLSGCGGSEPTGSPHENGHESPEPLCDGSDDLRLRYKIAIGLGKVQAGWLTMWENGVRWFAIDGRCRYWVFQSDEPHGLWNETRTGQLSEGEAAQIASDLQLHSFAEIAGRSREEGVFDMPLRTLATPSDYLVCEGACVDDVREGVLESAKDWLAHLYENGTPVENGLRATVDEFPEHAPSRPLPTKPFPEELTPYVQKRHDQGCPGETFVVPESIVPTLREYREEHRAVGDDRAWYRYISLERENGQRYRLYFRDRVPIENDLGLILFPKESPGPCF